MRYVRGRRRQPLNRNNVMLLLAVRAVAASVGEPMDHGARAAVSPTTFDSFKLESCECCLCSVVANMLSTAMPTKIDVAACVRRIAAGSRFGDVRAVGKRCVGWTFVTISIVGMLACGSSAAPNTKDILPPQLAVKNGTRITYSFSLDHVVDDKLADFVNELRLRNAEVKDVRILNLPATIELVLVDPARKADFIANVTKGIDIAVEPYGCESDEARRVCLRVLPDRAIERAIEQSISVIRRRLVAAKINGTVSTSEGRVVVDLSSADPREMSETMEIISRRARLGLYVIDNSKQMMSMYMYTRDDPAADAVEIKGQTDQWRNDSGEQIDYYLTARDREEVLSLDDARKLNCLERPDSDGMIRCMVGGRTILERYQREVAHVNPTFRITDDRRLGYEYIKSPDDSRRAIWRTYLLERLPAVSGNSIKSAPAAFDPTTKQAIVLVDLNVIAARMFSTLTSEIIGRKVAIMVDDRVRSSPIILSANSSGRFSISLGGGRLDQQEANELAIALTSGALPLPLRAESVVQLKDGLPQPLPRGN
jgi:preprotein translocase subunit SecD